MTIALDKMSTRRATGKQGEQIISLATLAVGGQGGGVLTNWIVAVAEANGFLAQFTSVAGVAQRTGATIYYVEMCKDTGKAPVFTLSPAQNDVDILIASELMEAGRAVLRGFTSPEFTTLIASTHRIAAISEKMTPGDGRVGHEEVVDALGCVADKVIAFDMEEIARDAGTVVSSSLFGALAGSGALPFPRESFETVISASGRGVAASLRAFGEAYERANGGAPIALPDIKRTNEQDAVASPIGNAKLVAQWRDLERRLENLPAPARTIARLGLQKVVDYQDIDYGKEYLERLEDFAGMDDGTDELSHAAAKYIAKAMCYDDIIRVADLKTRATRLDRVDTEIGLQEGQVVHLTEYFHPRFEEFYLGLPVRLGRRLQKSDRLKNLFERRFDKGRRIRTTTLRGFLTLWMVSGMRPWRRALLRHEVEVRHMEAWLRQAMDAAQSDPSLAAEILGCHRLVKGYSDTHARGLSKFDKITQAARALSGREDAADWVRRLRVAALEDVEGRALDDALKTVQSFME